MVVLSQKTKPQTPAHLEVTQTLSNSVKLSWHAPPNTGENNTFVLNINRTFNLTMNDLVIGEPVKQVEIKGLQPDKTYEFKIMAFNSIGSSQFSNPIRTVTLKTQLKPKNLPKLQMTQFNDIREAVCFELRQNEVDDLNGLVVRLDIATASLPNALNATKDLKRTYLISLNRLKFGQNCILFPQLVEIDHQRQLLKNRPKLSRFRPSYDLLMLNESDRSNIYTVKSDSNGLKNLPNNLGKSFFEFKHLNQLNISICFSNDTQVCTDRLLVNDYTSEVSMYITLIAVGCSAVLVLVVLLIASICCCYCCARRQQKNEAELKKVKGNKSSVPLDQNLVIKSFPIIPNGKSGFDYGSDESTKSSQQNILNGSNEISSHSSSSSGSHKYYNTGTGNKVIDMYDPNVQNRYIYTSQQANQANTSSIATVESDVSSSGNGSKSSANHSPYTVISDQNTNLVSTASSSGATAFCYNGTKYIKAYQSNTMTQQMKQMHHQFVNSSNGNEGSPESGYSTPVNAVSGTGTAKKLVYEVIV